MQGSFKNHIQIINVSDLHQTVLGYFTEYQSIYEIADRKNMEGHNFFHILNRCILRLKKMKKKITFQFSSHNGFENYTSFLTLCGLS